MRLYFETKVDQTPEQVFAQFDRDLFLSLNPPGLPVELQRFDGCKEKDEVHLKFPFGMKWISVITEQKSSENEIYFIDEGRTLPFPLKKWTHKHGIFRQNKGTIIVDDIFFSSSNKIYDYLILPVL